METRTERLTAVELNDALHDYIAIAITNDAVKAVADADHIEIGYEICETYEHKFGPLRSDGDFAVIEQLVGLGSLAIVNCARLTTLAGTCAP